MGLGLKNDLRMNVRYEGWMNVGLSWTCRVKEDELRMTYGLGSV